MKSLNRVSYNVIVLLAIITCASSFLISEADLPSALALAPLTSALLLLAILFSKTKSEKITRVQVESEVKPSLAPGWYALAEGNAQRYWTGQAWTETRVMS